MNLTGPLMVEPIEVANAIHTVIGVEGRYSNNPNDAGGETMWGITATVARANGYQGPMKAYPIELAYQVYLNRYWYDPGFHRIFPISAAISFELFDSGVNLGIRWPKVWLQQWLNGFNRNGADYPDLIDDATIGPATVAALNSFLKKRGPEGEKIMLVALNCSQAARYLELAEGRAANEDFLYGWIKNRVYTQLKEKL